MSALELTFTVSVAESLPVFVRVSFTAPMEAVLVTSVPSGVAPSITAAIVNEAVAPLAIVPKVQVGEPAGSSAQPAVVKLAISAGRLSVTVTPLASDGPLFVTETVYVTVPPTTRTRFSFRRSCCNRLRSRAFSQNTSYS